MVLHTEEMGREALSFKKELVLCNIHKNYKTMLPSVHRNAGKLNTKHVSLPYFPFLIHQDKYSSTKTHQQQKGAGVIYL